MAPTKKKEGSKEGKSGRTSEENQERAYIAASRRSDRSFQARWESAQRASEIHKKRTGRGFKLNNEIVMNEEIYEEEDDFEARFMCRVGRPPPKDLSLSERTLAYCTAQLPFPQTGSLEARLEVPDPVPKQVIRSSPKSSAPTPSHRSRTGRHDPYPSTTEQIRELRNRRISAGSQSVLSMPAMRPLESDLQEPLSQSSVSLVQTLDGNEPTEAHNSSRAQPQTTHRPDQGCRPAQPLLSNDIDASLQFSPEPLKMPSSSRIPFTFTSQDPYNVALGFGCYALPGPIYALGPMNTVGMDVSDALAVDANLTPLPMLSVNGLPTPQPDAKVPLIDAIRSNPLCTDQENDGVLTKQPLSDPSISTKLDLFADRCLNATLPLGYPLTQSPFDQDGDHLSCIYEGMKEQELTCPQASLLQADAFDSFGLFSDETTTNDLDFDSEWMNLIDTSVAFDTPSGT